MAVPSLFTKSPNGGNLDCLQLCKKYILWHAPGYIDTATDNTGEKKISQSGEPGASEDVSQRNPPAEGEVGAAI